jgi:GrpB-like predicted nucleotidyltransferase (UPF0157 family)
MKEGRTGERDSRLPPELEVIGAVRGDPILLVPYDDAWPARFAEWRSLLHGALGPRAVRIDHVGSTAVPGLPAKPVVDIQVSVTDVEDESAYVAAIESTGMRLRSREPGHRYFRPPPGIDRVVQIHVCAVGSDWERVHILFPAYLRANPARAAAYARLKRDLAAAFPDDRIGYTDAKGPFIEETLVMAATWAARTGWRPYVILPGEDESGVSEAPRDK